VVDRTGDALELRRALNARSPAGTGLIPFLHGSKVGPMWIRMLVYPSRAGITSMYAIPVAVDVQVRKVTEYLGVTDTGGSDLARSAAEPSSHRKPGHFDVGVVCRWPAATTKRRAPRLLDSTSVT
jgi:hypothetical protein